MADYTVGTGGDYANWAAVLADAATVAQNTLYVIGTITSDAILTTAALGGVAGTKTVIRGDHPTLAAGTLAFTGAAHYLSVNDDYLTVRNLTITSDVACVYLNQKGNVDIQYCNLRPGSASPAVNFASDGNVTYASVDISHNTMSGGQYGVSWYMSAALRNCDLTDCTITNNTITGATYSAIHLRTVAGAPDSLMTRVSITDNVISNCSTDGTNGRCAIDVEQGANTVGAGQDCLVARNTIDRCGGGTVAGAIAVRGFTSSTTAYGPNNAITGNTLTNLDGPNGGINVFYNSYLLIDDNYINGVTTDTIDGDGILADHSNEGVWIHRNRIYNLTGQAAAINSACGIMILDSTLVKCTGNIGDGMKVGIFLGDDDYAGGSVVDHQSSTCYNNTFTGITTAAVYVSSACDDPSVHVLRNNRFEGVGYTVDHESAGAEHVESNNAFIGFSSGAVTHTLDATDVATVAACSEGGLWIAGVRAYDDLPLPLHPDIGAVQDRNAAGRRFGVGGGGL